jgi:NAD-dependent deacetylase
MIPKKINEILRNSQHIAVFTGAGISAESGIPTFRDVENGIWGNVDLHKVATKSGYKKDPVFAWNWYEWARNEVATKKPNYGHQIISELEKYIPKVTVITQNVDDLHERAGSSNVLHIHGTLQKIRCMECEYQNYVTTIPSNSSQPHICPECGGILRPDVVWFGDSLPTQIWDQAEKVSREECDLMLIIGSSGLIFPANSLPILAIDRGINTIQINKEVTDLDKLVTVNLSGCAGEVLSKMFEFSFGDMK